MQLFLLLMATTEDVRSLVGTALVDQRVLSKYD